MADRTADFAQFHSGRPAGGTVLETAIGEPIPDLGPLQHMERTLGRLRRPATSAGTIRSACRATTWCSCRSRADEFADRLLAAGAAPRRARDVRGAAGRGRHAGLRQRHRRKPLRRRGRPRRMRSVTPRAAISARSRSSWPAIGPGTSTARSAASSCWRTRRRRCQAVRRGRQGSRHRHVIVAVAAARPDRAWLRPPRLRAAGDGVEGRARRPKARRPSRICRSPDAFTGRPTALATAGPGRRSR